MFQDLEGKFKENATKISATEKSALRTEFPGIPEPYLQFLGQIGYGGLDEINLFSRPVYSDEIYPKSVAKEHIILFGDDMTGYCFGFDLNDNFRIVEIDPFGDIDNEAVEPEFTLLIRRYFPKRG